MTSNIDQLRQIQDGCVSRDTSVSDLLRRCQILAARVKVTELGDWVRYELNGYPTEIALPSYRIVDGRAMGHFMGPYGGGLKYVPLPSANLPEKHRDWARRAYLRQPIAALEEVAVKNGGKERSITVPWPADLVVTVRDNFYQNMSLVQAWLELSRSQFIGAVEAVRNRILGFAIDAEPHVGGDGSSPSKQSTLASVFHTHIYGPVGNLAQGSSDFAQSTGVAPGDLQGLLAELTRLGLHKDDATELSAAIAEDGPLKGGKVGKKVAAWLGKMVTKAVTGAWNVATSTATSILPKLIAEHYNLPY